MFWKFVKNFWNSFNLFWKKTTLDFEFCVSLANKEREVPDYLQLDEKQKKIKFVRMPKFSEVPYPVVMEPNLVIEYYSR